MWWLASILIAAAIGAVVRFASRKVISDGKALVYIDEFIGQAFSGVFIMELGIIGAEYGAPSLVLGLLVFAHFLARNMYFAYSCGLYDNPVAFVGAYYAAGRRVTTTLVDAVCVLATQIVGLLAGQWFAKFVWKFADHAHIDAISAACHSTLSTAYPWQQAAFLEAFGVFVLVLVSLVVTQTHMQVLALSATATALCTLLSHASGLFMNASIATAFTYGCNGHPEEWKFLVVYWVAPMVGIAAANEFWLVADRVKGLVGGKHHDKHE